MEQLSKQDLAKSAEVHIEQYKSLILTYEKMLKGKYESKKLREKHKAELKRFKTYLAQWKTTLNELNKKEQ